MSDCSADPNALQCPHASTIVILREVERATGGMEVFMVQRHARSRFLADRFVYPGGKLDAADCTERAARRVEGRAPDEALSALGAQSFEHDAEGAERSTGLTGDPAVATGLFLAGIRETFEEAGILLARRADQAELIDLTSDPEVAARFQTYRRRLNKGEVALSRVAELEDLYFPLDRIAYFAHWITPYAESIRYDTRFFLALAPERQRPLHDARETTDSTWISPRDAIQANQSGDFQLAPPTLHTLQRLAEFDTARAAFDWALGHRPPTILPHVEPRDGQLYLLLPGDPDFPHAQDAYQIASPVTYGATRMIAENPGLWRVPRG